MSSSFQHYLVDWVRRGYFWEQIVQSKEAPFRLAAGATKVIPLDRFIFKAKEGVIQAFSATFDHPKCGIKVRYGLPGGQEYDSKDIYTIRNYMIGSSHNDRVVYVNAPHYTPVGLYLIKRTSAWYFHDWLELSLINIDTEDHYCMGYGYGIHLMKKREKHDYGKELA